MTEISREQRVKERYVIASALKTTLEGAYVADFAGKNLSINYNVDCAASIFAAQMIAIATHKDNSVNLAHSLALILLGGVCESDLDNMITDTVIDEVFLTNKWGRDLFDEYLSGNTDSAQFAIKCRQLERQWDSQAVSDAALEFLKNIDEKMLIESRAGWVKWHVDSELVDTVAGHTILAQLLAIIVNTEYMYEIDIERVILALAVKHLPAAKLGDIPLFKMHSDEKKKLEKEAFWELVCQLPDGEFLAGIFEEAQEHKSRTMEYEDSVGKCETDFQAKMFGEKQCVDLTKQDDNSAMEDPCIQKLLDSGCSWPEMWIRYSQENFGYDENFMAIADYLVTCKLFE